jgi:acetyltransferase
MTKITKKPITVAWTTGDVLVGDNLKTLAEGGVQFYKSPVRAVRAMGALMNYAAFRNEYLERTKAAPASGADNVKESAVSLLSGASRSLTEHQGKELFSLYDITVTKEGVATSEDDAVRIGEDIGYPLVLKIDSPDILHKTEAGGLKLNIKNRDELVSAYNEVLANARNYDAKAHINGVLIQEMVSGGTEVIVGVNNDPQFGPTIMFGLGGIFVEILKDVALRIAPLNAEEAMDMIKEIKGFKVLAGARGQAKADIQAIADTLVKVSRLAVDLEDHVAELDINPLLALPEGQGVRVADALVIQK